MIAHHVCTKLSECSIVEWEHWNGHKYPSPTVLWISSSHHQEQHSFDAFTGSIYQVDILIATRYSVSMRDKVSNVSTDNLYTSGLRVGTCVLVSRELFIEFRSSNSVLPLSHPSLPPLCTHSRLHKLTNTIPGTVFKYELCPRHYILRVDAHVGGIGACR